MARKPIYKRIWPYVVVGVLAIGALGGNSSDKKPEEEKPATRVVFTPAPDSDIFVSPQQDLPEETPAPLQTLGPVPEAAQLQDRSIPEPTPAPIVTAPPTPAPTPVPVQASAPSVPTSAPVRAQEPAPEVTPAPAPEPPAPTPDARGCYITPTGKRYHFDKECAGPNAIPITVGDAVARGYTPCKTCSGG